MPGLAMARMLGTLALAFVFAGIARGQVQDDRHDAYAQAHITWSLYHETGHAIQDFTADRFLMSNAEREVHADKIAAYLMIPNTEDDYEYQIYYDAAMDLYMDTQAPDPNHIYETGRVRAERMFCMLYGARPNSRWIALAQKLKNRSDSGCIADFKAFQEETVDVLGFAREITNLDEPKMIDPQYVKTNGGNLATAYNYLQDTQILLLLAIDVEEWLPALQVSEKPFKIIAQGCNGYDGFRYSWEESAVVVCYEAIQRCMKRPGLLLPPLSSGDEVAVENQGAEADEEDWVWIENDPEE